MKLPRSTVARALALVLVATTSIAGLLVGSSAAVAKSPHVVDPASVQPALNPDFAPWSCFRTGQGIICQGSLEDSWENELFGQCDGRDVYISGSVRAHTTRWHTSEGLATKTIVHLSAPADTFSFSPTGDGPTLVIRGHWNRHYTYPDPGDLTTRVLTEVGAIYLANSPGRGIVVHDTGKVTFEPGADYEEIAVMRGVHDFYSDIDTAEERLICGNMP
jgi:hypothetical protein